MAKPAPKRNGTEQTTAATAAVRLECLKLTNPNVSAADTSMWISKAKELESYVTGGGQVSETPPEGQKPKDLLGV